VATVKTPDAPALLTDAFGGAFWWATCIGAAAILPITLLARHRAVKDVPVT
jgi:hypothetical protein